MIKNISRNQNTMFGGKMTEKLIENKFNAWRAKYYSQNWGDKNLENLLFYMDATQSTKNQFG